MGLIPVRTAAETKRVTTKAIYYALTQGTLTRYELNGRLLIDEDELKRYVPRGFGDVRLPKFFFDDED